MSHKEATDDEIEEWMEDHLKRINNDLPMLISLEPVIVDIVKTKDNTTICKKIEEVERRFHEGQGMLNAFKKVTIQAFAIELKNSTDESEKVRIKEAIIKLFGFEMK